jgi:tRNA A37 N6-isopentenylltransferase MiaA
MIYKVKSGFRLRAGLAQTVGEECERLESEGRLTPRNLVEASRPDDAPLHDCFEWDDTAAAEKWRDAQAAYIIRSVEVSVTEHSEPTRAFVATVSDGKSEYRSVGYVLRDAESRDALLDSARRELLAFRRKYSTLHELSDVFAAIDGAVGSQQVLELAG